ncbi:hypothetical protein P3S67_000108 [Capsicum chacoense]
MYPKGGGNPFTPEQTATLLQLLKNADLGNPGNLTSDVANMVQCAGAFQHVI